MTDLQGVASSTDFDALFRQWYAPLVRYANVMTHGDLDDAEDLVQQVFIKYWEVQDQLVIQHSPKAYLYKMVYNRALNRARDQKTRKRHIDHQTSIMEHAYEPPPDTTDTDLQHRYQNALKKLPAQCRQVFELNRLEDLKYREIAEHLGISIKTVETHMGKALRILRLELADFLVLLLITYHS